MIKFSDNEKVAAPITSRAVTITDKDLPLHCPMPQSTLWNSHPRVYIPIQEDSDQTAICPYCGTAYSFKKN